MNDVGKLVDAKAQANEAFASGRYQDAISQYADVALRCCDLTLRNGQSTFSGSEHGSIGAPSGRLEAAGENIPVLLLTSLVNLSAAVLQLVSCKSATCASHRESEEEEDKLVAATVGLLSWAVLVGTVQPNVQTDVVSRNPVYAFPWDSIKRERWRTFAQRWALDGDGDHAQPPSEEPFSSSSSSSSSCLAVLVQRLCSATSSDPPTIQHNDNTATCVLLFCTNCIPLASPSILLKACYRMAKLHQYMCERSTQRGIAQLLAQEGKAHQPSPHLSPASVPHGAGSLIKECATKRFEHCVEGLLYAELPVRHLVPRWCASNDETHRNGEKRLGDDTAALVGALKSVAANFYHEMYASVVNDSSSGGGTQPQQQVFVHPDVLLTNARSVVKHGVGVVALADLPAGTTVLVEKHPLVCGVAPRRKHGGGDEEQEHAAADFEARFVSAVESMMRMWNALKKKESPLGMSPTTHAKSVQRNARALLTLLALHSRAASDGSVKANDGGATEDSVDDQVLAELCDVWHHNSMRLCEVDFRIAPGASANNPTEATVVSKKKVSEAAGLRGASGLYVFGSRLNHSCTPNALCNFSTPRWADGGNDGQGDGATRSIAFEYNGELVVRLLRDVAVGEEICISYSPILSSTETKQRHCRSFSCACALCGNGSNNGVHVGSGDDAVPVSSGGMPAGGGAVPPLEAVRCTACGSFVDLMYDGAMRDLNEASVAIVADTLLPAGAVCDNHVRGGHSAACPVASSTDSLSAFQTRLRRAVDAVEKKMKEILRASSAATARPRDVMRGLMALEDCCGGSLGPTHWMRLQLLQELLAAGVAASLTAEDSLRLVGAARKLLQCAESLCPLNWPLVTGFRMHLVFCLGRHHLGTEPRNHSTNDGREETPISAYVVSEEIRYLITASFQEHTVQMFGRLENASDPLGGTSRFDETCILPAFLERYRCELEAAGVACSEDLVQLAQLNDEADSSIAAAQT